MTSVECWAVTAEGLVFWRNGERVGTVRPEQFDEAIYQMMRVRRELSRTGSSPSKAEF